MNTTIFIHPLSFSCLFSSRRYVPSWHSVRGTWPCWGPRPAAAWSMWAPSSLCPPSSLWLLHLCGIACRKGSSISAWRSKSYRYWRRWRRCRYTHTYCVWIRCNNQFSLCKYVNRARPLLLIGWAVCRPLSIHCPLSKTIRSFCITFPTLCKCPASLANGWTGTSWAPGTVSDSKPIIKYA